jgi:glycine/D-amino acid oxidase-like deaminating enzyme/nitrite reductase/ring-hydroxylating ferredoxin subunit
MDASGKEKRSTRGLPGKPVSIWIDTVEGPRHAPLTGDRKFDVVVVGAGIAGLTTAALLVREGMKVAVVEARRVAEGVSGHTTAKLTFLHTLAYRSLVTEKGAEKARMYADANEEGIRRAERFVKELGIDCDWTPADAFTWAEDGQELGEVEEEAAALEKIGRKAEVTTDVGLPFRITGAVRVRDQAHFHPRKYLLGLAQDVVAGGGEIFEGSPASDLSTGKRCVVTTAGGRATADTVVLATHQPFVLRGLYYARMTLRRSYVLGVVLRGPVPRGMGISASRAFHSLRPQRVPGRDVLLVGGEPHHTGQEADTSALVRRLAAWATEKFPVEEIRWRWATHDNVTPDHVPFVGPLTPRSKNVLVATGFGGWGMSNGTAAGMLLSDLVRGRANPWRELYDPARETSGDTLKALVHDATVETQDLVEEPTSRPASEGPLQPGEGRIVDSGFDKLAVHLDDAGKRHAVGAACTHLGCLVKWNSAERSWDCPCHGSRFDPDGHVLHGPAVRDLPREGTVDE